ncbi:MAG TPA: hypothetical protein VFU28_22775 [Vicinamibacterales bacterium]|nr:hypothetical protein [Vicinamibacterales bacterium]
MSHARIKYGPDVSLIDLSVGGAQFETTSYRPQLGSTLVIELAAGERTWPVPARVLRCHLASLAPHPTYRGAVAFKRSFDFEEIAGVVQHEVDVNPVQEFTRLNLALKQIAESTAASSALSVTGMRALESTFAMIEAGRRRESTAPFIDEMGRLLRIMTTALENAADPSTMVPQIIARLHRSVPSLMVRIVDANQASLIRNDAVYFRVPTEGIDVPECLIVEFPQDCALEAWHLQLLEAGAQLVAVSKDLASSHERAKEEPELRGWNKLVVHYLDGRLLKGYGRDLQPTRGSLDLCNDPDGPDESRMTIPFAHLKAVFFVQDFAGNPDHLPRPDADDPSARGRRVTVTFVDGEVLRGATLGYSQNAPGFFVSPLDSTSNNTRIFVLAGAIRHVQFHDASSRTSAPQPLTSVRR